MSSKESNPIVCVHHGFEVRRYNQVNISLSDHEYIKALDAHVASGKLLSLGKILALQGQPCQQCGNDNFTLLVPKNILSIKKGGSGGNITSRKKK